MLPDPVAPIESLTATSIMGWGGFIFGLVACLILVWDRILGKGKSLAGISNKIDTLCGDVREIETTQKVMDTHLRSLDTNVQQLTYEIKGVDGRNGIKEAVREQAVEIAAIHERNRKADILAAIYERELKFEGPERRRLARQAKEILSDEGGG